MPLTLSPEQRASIRALLGIGTTGRSMEWHGLRAVDRAKPLSDMGLKLLNLHLFTTTTKEPLACPTR